MWKTKAMMNRAPINAPTPMRIHAHSTRPAYSLWESWEWWGFAMMTALPLALLPVAAPDDELLPILPAMATGTACIGKNMTGGGGGVAVVVVVVERNDGA